MASTSWQEYSEALRENLPLPLQPWLTQAYILTQHLKACGEWRLQVLSQQWDDQGETWQRSVLHLVDGQPKVFATVSMPKATYQKLSAQLGDLQDKPIGETLLYHNDAVRRSPFTYKKITESDKPVLPPELPATWARRSTFYWQGAPLTITEYFVEAMPSFPRIKAFQKRKQAMTSRLVDYSHLIRLHRPVPILLMLWPTLTALWIASQGIPSWHLLWVFSLGVLVMRSAGDILNDLADRKLDGYVERTRLRPLATGRISVKHALLAVGVLLLVALGLVLLLNRLCLGLAVVGLGLAIIYPFMKRFTYFPQVVLGMAYNWGIIMAFAAVQNTVPAMAWLFWATTILWTVAYDSMYALADREDDKKIGLKSTAVLFGQHYHLAIALLQILSLAGWLFMGYWLQFTWSYYLSLLLCAGLMIYQHHLLPGFKIQNCLKAFNHNQWVGIVLFFAVIWQISVAMG